MRLEKSQPEDTEECVRWMMANLDLNDCSPRTLRGCTFFKIAGILYLPAKPVLMLESLAPNPAVTGAKRLLALRRAMDDIRKLYPQIEILFLTRKNQRLAKCAESYGFERAEFEVYRLIDGSRPKRRTKAQSSKLPESGLRHNAGGSRSESSSAEGIVRDLRGAVQ